MFEFIDVQFKDILSLPSLQIDSERITTLVGASGSGKTTILRMLNKMISPTQGKILFHGQDLCEIKSVFHRRRVTMLPQNPVMLEEDVRGNLCAGLKFQDRPPASDAELLAVLEKVKLKKALDGAANTLSGGEKQRLALARLLLLNPEVYLLDEPSSALDDATENAIIEMVTEHVKKEHKTLIMVTHSKAIAEQYSDVIIEIAAGSAYCRKG